jgi:hypothetical protein
MKAPSPNQWVNRTITATDVPTNPVPASPTSRHGNSNYVLFATGGNPLLTGVSVTISITEPMVFQSGGTPYSGTYGFAFQLNAYSPSANYSPGQIIEATAIQQYVFSLLESELVGWVNNWTRSQAASGAYNNATVNSQFNLLRTGSPDLGPPYTLTIKLWNDSNGNINGVSFLVLDSNDVYVVNLSIYLADIGVSATDMAPIVGFQLNIVGPENSEGVYLSSGSGMITYTASNPLTASTGPVPNAENQGSTTENANNFYGSLPVTDLSNLTNQLTQPFKIGTELP